MFLCSLAHRQFLCSHHSTVFSNPTNQSAVPLFYCSIVLEFLLFSISFCSIVLITQPFFQIRPIRVQFLCSIVLLFSSSFCSRVPFVLLFSSLNPFSNPTNQSTVPLFSCSQPLPLFATTHRFFKSDQSERSFFVFI